jgi:hypothetical protein
MRELWLRRAAPRLDSDRGLWLAIFAVFASVYALTAHWTFPGLDTEAAAWPAWSLVHRGTLNLLGIAHLPQNAWFIHAHGQLLSNRTIGVVLAGVPANALLGWTGITPAAAAALTAVVLTAAAVATTAVVLRSLAGLSWALGATLVVGFGTAMWTVSATELWTHSPDALWLALVMFALSRRRYALAGLAFVPALLTRPHLAVAGLAIAFWLTVAERSWRPLVRIAVPVIGGLFAVVTVNHAIYGAWSLTGGYGLVGYSATSIAGTGGSWSAPFVTVGHNLLGALFSPRCGVFLYTPVALVGLLGLPRGFRSAPRWTHAAAFGGCAYELAQSKINLFTGGSLFFSNRLIIECLLLCTPLLVHCALRWTRTRPRAAITAVLAAAAVAMHAMGALLPTPGASPAYIQPWRDWLLLFWLRNAGPVGQLKAVVVVLVALAALKALADLRASKPASSGARPGSSRHQDDWHVEQVLPV